MIDEKKIEEAAINASIEDTSKGIVRDGYMISAKADHELGFQEGFKAGINWFKDNLWHDATQEQEPQGVSDNRAVLVVGIRKGRVAYQYLWSDWEDCYRDLEILSSQTPKIYSHAMWAYVRDIVPCNLNEQL